VRKFTRLLPLGRGWRQEFPGTGIKDHSGEMKMLIGLGDLDYISILIFRNLENVHQRFVHFIMCKLHAIKTCTKKY
jgi:hypothetical protein